MNDQNQPTRASLLLPFALCAGLSAQTLPQNIDISVAADGVVALPASVSPVFANVFDRYTKIVAPNGRAIHILLQSQVTNEMGVRAREIMRFFLKDVPGTQYGADKSIIANTMGNNDATLVYFNTEQAAQAALQGPLGNAQIFGQDLYASESVVEGSGGYANNTPRDATLEEVFHLVHGAGIEPALPAFHAEILAATNQAIAAGLWTPPPGLPVADNPFEYIISVIDVMYGYWAHDPEGNGTSFGGEYTLHTPAEVASSDPVGLAAMLKFLPRQCEARLSVVSGFAGTFAMALDPAVPYTLKSSHLTDLALTGANHANIAGNAHDNHLRGNRGNNTIDGAGGVDRVTFTGPKAEYQLQASAGSLVVTDSVAGRDGVDTLRSIEWLVFADGPVQVEKLAVDRAAVRVPMGGTQAFSLDLGTAHAAAVYAIFGSATGVAPGVTVGGQQIPLVPDWYTTVTPWSPWSAGFLGVLDGSGRATAVLSVPSGLPSSLVGARLYHAAVAFGSGSLLGAVSNAVSVTLVN